MWRRGPVCACTRVCWCRRIFTYIHTLHTSTYDTSPVAPMQECKHHPPTTLPPPCSPAHPTEASRASPVPYPYISLSPPFFSCLIGIPTAQRYLYLYAAARIHYIIIIIINHIATTTGPRPSHGGYPPPALYHAATHPHPPTNNSAYDPRALKKGGKRRRTPPITNKYYQQLNNTSTRTQTIKSGQLILLLNLSLRHQNYTTPPHHRGLGLLPPGAATPPICRGPVCACTRVCWCRQIFTYIHTYIPPYP